MDDIEFRTSSPLSEKCVGTDNKFPAVVIDRNLTMLECNVPFQKLVQLDTNKDITRFNISSLMDSHEKKKLEDFLHLHGHHNRSTSSSTPTHNRNHHSNSHNNSHNNSSEAHQIIINSLLTDEHSQKLQLKFVLMTSVIDPQHDRLHVLALPSELFS